MRALSLIALTVCLAALPLRALALDGFPAFPMAFWGDVTVDGNVAPAGSRLRTYYGAALAGSVVLQEAGTYGYNDPLKQKLVVGEGTGPITFTIEAPAINGGIETGGNVAVAHSSFSAGTTEQKALAFTVSSGDSEANDSQTSPSSRGGGGGIVPLTDNASQAKSGDATGDGRIDVLDFNALLIQWGTTGNGLTADFDGNTIVDILDFNLLLINWQN